MKLGRKSNKSVLAKAAELLARQEESSQRLREKLLLRGYESGEIEEAIGYLQKKHYLDDEAACKHQFSYLYEESSESVRRICAKLMQRGFRADMVASCVPDDTVEREREAAKKQLRRKSRQAVPSDRLKQYLFRRGFRISDIEAVVQSQEEFYVD